MASSTAARCPECGHENNPRYKFCGMCGTALGAGREDSSGKNSSLTVGGYSILGLTENIQPTSLRDAPAAQNPRLPSYLAPQFAAHPVAPERNGAPRTAEPRTSARPPVNSPPVRSHDQERDNERSRGHDRSLGNGNERSSLSLDYLFEGEEKKAERRWPIYVAVALLATVAGLVWQWQRNGYPWDDLTPLSAQDTGKLNGNRSAVTPTQPEAGMKPGAGVAAQAAKPAAEEVRSPAAGATKTDSDSGDSTSTDSAPTDSSSSEVGKPALKPGSDSEAGPTPKTEAKAEDSAEAKNTDAKNTDTKNAVAKNTDTPVATDPAADAKNGDSSNSDESDAAEPIRNVIPNEASSPAEAAELLIEGSKYLLGNGVAQDCDRAQKDLRAASRFSSEANSMLGTMYASGHCVSRDLPTAYRWYARALHNKPDNTRIQNDLTVLWNQMSPAERKAASRSGT